MIVRPAPIAHFEWLVERTGCAPTDDFRAIEAVDSTGRIRGMVGFDLWTKNSCQAHMATDTPMAWRHLARAAAEYVFGRAGMGMVLGMVSGRNEMSLRTAKRLGFREAHVIREGCASGVDLVLLELRREDCRWLDERKAA